MSTFGNTNIEAQTSASNAGLLVAYKVTLAEEATIQSISFYLSTAAGNVRLAIYDDDGGAPDALQCETDPVAAEVGWNTLEPVTPPLLAAGTYWLAFQLDSDTSVYRWAAGGSSGLVYRLFTYGAFPNPFTPVGYEDRIISIYGSYGLDGVVVGYAAIF